MSVERGVEAFAGFMVLVSVALTYFVHPGFVWLTVFVGANLFQQAFSGLRPAFVLAELFGDVLADNVVMLALCRSLGFREESQDHVVRVTLPLTGR